MLLGPSCRLSGGTRSDAPLERQRHARALHSCECVLLQGTAQGEGQQGCVIRELQLCDCACCAANRGGRDQAGFMHACTCSSWGNRIRCCRIGSSWETAYKQAERCTRRAGKTRRRAARRAQGAGEKRGFARSPALLPGCTRCGRDQSAGRAAARSSGRTPPAACRGRVHEVCKRERYCEKHVACALRWVSHAWPAQQPPRDSKARYSPPHPSPPQPAQQPAHTCTVAICSLLSWLGVSRRAMEACTMVDCLGGPPGKAWCSRLRNCGQGGS